MKRLSTLLAFIAFLLAYSPALAFVPPIPPPAPTIKATAAQTGALAAGNMVGDSLTVAGQDITDKRSVTSVLQALSGMQWNNYGIGGQPSTPIAMRGGGVGINLTFSSNQIANNSLNTVTAINGVALTGTATTQSPDYRFLSTPAANSRIEAAGTVCGIHGRLYATGSGGPPSTSVTYTFASDTQLSVVTTVSCAAQSPFTPDISYFGTQPAIYWAGRNNYNNTSVVLSDVASMVATSSGNYLVFGVITAESAGEYVGQAGNTNINTINTTEASLYGAHFVNINSLLIANATADILDQQDVANGVVPNSLRAILLNTTLGSALGATGCPTLATAAVTGTYAIDGEYIIATAVSGNAVTSCTRGQGVGGVAASHSSGATVQVRDSVHLSGAAEALIANTVYTTKWSVLVPSAAYGNIVATASGVSSALAAPGGLGGANGPAININSPIYFNRLPVLGYQTPFYTRDANGNYVQAFSYTSSGLSLGGAFVSVWKLCTGGAGGCSVTGAGNGDVMMANGLTVGSATDATLSAGQVGLAKIAASGTAPGAGYLKFEVVAGTNAGTCKIQAYAGTSATPVTVVDNVGSGC